MSDPLCFVCRGPTPCYKDGDPGPIKTYMRMEVPSAAFVQGIMLLPLIVLAAAAYVIWTLHR